MFEVAAHPSCHTMLQIPMTRFRISPGTTSIASTFCSGEAACMRLARAQNARTAIHSVPSNPSVTRKGSEAICSPTIVGSTPKRRASHGPTRAATMVTTWLAAKNEPIWPDVH